MPSKHCSCAAQQRVALLSGPTVHLLYVTGRQHTCRRCVMGRAVVSVLSSIALYRMLYLTAFRTLSQYCALLSCMSVFCHRILLLVHCCGERCGGRPLQFDPSLQRRHPLAFANCLRQSLHEHARQRSSQERAPIPATRGAWCYHTGEIAPPPKKK